MTIKDLLRQNRCMFALRILFEHWLKARFFMRHLANRARQDNERDMHTDLLVRVHAIEKGMSIGHVRPGFGQPKALAIIRDLNTYLQRGGDRLFAAQACGILLNYCKFCSMRGDKMEVIKESLDTLMLRWHIDASDGDGGGVVQLAHVDVSSGARGDYSRLSQHRYAVRDFGDAPVDLSKIEQALKLCERTPSACNRQSWRVHVFTEPSLKNRLFALQGGCRGFYEDMQCAILICVDAKNYAFPEFQTGYVDGGIYAMNLMYALNYCDLATIPLTLGLKESSLRQIKRQMKLPDNEIPVLLIGVGTYKEHFRVAASARTAYGEYVKFNQ